MIIKNTDFSLLAKAALLFTLAGLAGLSSCSKSRKISPSEETNGAPSDGTTTSRDGTYAASRGTGSDWNS